MIINFECKRCHRFFNSDVGSVTLPEDSERPHFEKMPLCPTCDELTIDDVWLTELGQSQLTEAIFGRTANRRIGLGQHYRAYFVVPLGSRVAA